MKLSGKKKTGVIKKNRIWRKGRIGVRLLLYFTATMVVVFAMLVLLFNLVMEDYIRRQSAEQLSAARDAMLRSQSQSGQFFQPPLPQIDGIATTELLPGLTSRAAMDLLRRGRDNRDVQALIADDAYKLVFPNAANDMLMDVAGMTTLVESMQHQNTVFAEGVITRVQTTAGVYYVSVHDLASTDSGTPAAKLVLFVHTERYRDLINSVNTVLFSIVLLALGVSVLASFLLARSIGRSLGQLTDFARELGNGDFSTHPFDFRDHEIAELGSHMNQTAERLGAYDKEQKTFFQNVSHELRTPLMSIQGYAEGIQYGVFPDNAEAAVVIVDESRRLTGMVEDLLYLSRMDAAPALADPYPVDLREILEDCAERLAGYAMQLGKKIHLALPDAPMVTVCEGGALGRAVGNLVSNGIHYAKTQVELSCGIEDGRIVLRVADDGAGIDGEDLPHLFERFYKGKTGHHGIGLAIVKSIVEQHSGEVSARNRPEGGAEFSLSIPVRL